MSKLPKAYRQRLVRVLKSEDIRLLMNRIDEYGLDLVDSRFWLIDNWNDKIQTELFKILNDRLK